MSGSSTLTSLKFHVVRRVGAVIVGVMGVAACDRAPSPTGLKEWTAADHDMEPGQSAKQGSRAKGAGPNLADLTWQNQCATCHGALGRGDGPQGPMYKPTDLSRPDWQDRTKDDEIAATIRNGKGRMPKFDLPDDVVAGLVGRIRLLRGK